MSLIIGGVSVGGALAAGAATAVGSYAVGQIVGGSSGGGGGGSSGGVAGMADPFSAWRPAYQQSLADFMANPNNTSPDYYGASKFAGTQPNQGMQMMQDMLTPGYQFSSNDPSYQFRLQQGAGALASSNAAKGLLNSGAAAVELTNYGQQAASQEYQAQFNRASGLNTASAQAQQQTFQNLMGLNANYSNMSSNMFSRLAQLSGANTGNPAAAAQLQQQQNAATAAGVQQIVDPITGAIKQAVGGSGSSGSNYDYSGMNQLIGAGGQSISSLMNDYSYQPILY